MNIKRIKNITAYTLICVLLNNTLLGTITVSANEINDNTSRETEITEKSIKVTHTGIVTSTTLNVRTQANASAKKIGEFKKGNKVEIVAKASNGWYKVKYKNTYGYLNGAYLKDIKSVTTAGTTTESNTNLKVTHTGIVTSTTLNVRTQADASAKKIGEFKKGNKVEIVAKASNGWYKVKYKNTYGYLNGAYLKDIKKVGSTTTVIPVDEVIRTGVVNVDEIEIKTSTSTESDLKGSLAKGTLVEIVKIESNGWYKIKFDKDYGYVQAEFIDLNRNSNTKVTGLNTNITKTAGQSLSDKITVEAAYGRNVKLQMYNTSTKKWETKATFKTKNEETSEVSLKYPAVWYNQVSSKWRVVIDAKEELKPYTSKEIKITAKRVYENPAGYIQLKEKITVSGGGRDLVKGTMGLRVAKVQRKLGMGRIWEKVDTKTMEKVKTFQRKNGLKATGVVDLKTWKKLGFSESDWYNLDAYVTPVKTKLTATRKDLIEQMIATAESYLGTEYVVGAAGKPGTGIDCSGLVMQALYSIGIDPAPVSVTRHTQPGYEYESRNLWKFSSLKTVSKPQRGDLVFYQNKQGVIIHVAIYLGNDRVIESWPEKVVNLPLKHPSRPYIKGYKRVLG